MWTRLVFVSLFLAAVSACDPKPLYGVTYSPLALNTEDICLPVEQVRKDMEIIATMSHSVRIYNIGVCYDNAIAVMESAKENDMTVLMGLWMEANNTAVFENEFELLPEFMEKYGDIIEYVIVGNEPVFIELIDVYEVIDNYNRVKQFLADNGYPHESSVAEVWPVWETEEGFELAEALDFVCMNMQPYWEGFYAECPSNETECVPAGEYIHLKTQGLEDYFEKKVVLCEAGWPTEGEPCCSGSRDNAQDGFHAVPSLENASAFVSNFVEHARERQVKYYIHTSFDEEWKKVWDPCDECKGRQVSKFSEDECNGCQVDYNWGVYTYEREYKEGYELPEHLAQCSYT